MNAPRHELLARLQALGVLRPLDVELGLCLYALEPDAPVPGLLAAAASLAVSQGHSCLPLAHMPAVLGEACGEGVALPELPDEATLHAALQASAWAAPAGETVAAPLLYDEQRVWLGRYFHHEVRVAQRLGELLDRPRDVPDATRLRTALQPFFRLDGSGIDHQALAALTGLVSPLTVITGGPGTGKTTTVLWLLAAWTAMRLQQGHAAPRIHLAAPTGKAAARLSESLHGRLADLNVADEVRTALPTAASTLHRLLGVRRGSSRFRHHAGHPLDTDLVVVDEVSMVDLPLMARLLDALPAHARLVLLGDRDQLASVEAGNVLAAICVAAGTGIVSPQRAAMVEAVTGTTLPADAGAPRFADAVVELQRSHRFGADSGLGQAAARVRAGDADGLLDGLRDGVFAGVTLDAEAAVRPWETLVERHVARFAALAACPDPSVALERAAEHRVLTALREGGTGSRALNAAFEQALRQRAGVAPEQSWYAGRLLLVTRNDYGVELYNGDIGIVMPDATGTLRAWFPAADGGVRALALSALPECESAWAMSIHKSQGSEFDAIDIVLPPGPARVLGRELLYTAITRARGRVNLVATVEVLRQAVQRSTRRFSGLADRLSGEGPGQGGAPD